MKVGAEIEFFRTNHARPAGSAWKYTNCGHKVVGGTSDRRNPITIRPCSSDTPTSDFGSPGRQNRINESCSRDRALSNQPCPTGRFRLEVPQWIDFSSRGNFIFSKSYYNLNMNIGPPIFDFFMTQMRISKSMTPLKFTPTFPYIIDQERTCFPEMSRDFQKLQNVSHMIISTCLRFPI